MNHAALKLSPYQLGLACALASALLFSVRPVLVKLAYMEGLDPTSLMLFRMLFSFPFYLAILAVSLRNFKITQVDSEAGIDAKLVAKILTTGVCGYYAASYLDLLGLQYVSAQLGRMILYLYPTLVVVGAAIYSKRPLQRSVILSLLLAYSGVLIIFGHDLSEFGNDISKGSVFIVLCACCYAAYLVSSKPLIQQVGSALFTSIALLGASAAIVFHYALIVGLNSDALPAFNSFSARAYWLCVCIAVFCTVLPTVFVAYAIQSIGPGPTSITSMIGPVFTSLFAVSLLGEQFTVYHLMGIGLIISGIALLDREQ